MSLERLLEAPPYALGRNEREPLLLTQLNALTAHHRAHCPPYAQLAGLLHASAPAARLADVPFLPVGLFKSHKLASVPDDAIFKTLTSSGTTSEEVSRVFLDRRTAELQSKALAKIMGQVLGGKRVPMVIVDQKNLLKDRTAFSARGAGVLGMMNFGRDPFYALDEACALDLDGLKTYLHRHAGEPLLIFGFTFMVWQYLYRRIANLGLDLRGATLIHSGGWKKLQEEAVGNDTFKTALRKAAGIERVYNFYGMVEQVGSVFLEGEDGFLYAPSFAEVIVRDPVSWREAPRGAVGVIQVLSGLPHSYPGHSILTEDLGAIHGVDDGPCGRKGTYFRVVGRVPRSELRGCSDTHAYRVQP